MHANVYMSKQGGSFYLGKPIMLRNSSHRCCVLQGPHLISSGAGVVYLGVDTPTVAWIWFLRQTCSTRQRLFDNAGRGGE